MANPVRQPFVVRRASDTVRRTLKGLPTGITSHWDSLAAQQAALDAMGTAGGSWWYRYAPDTQGLVTPAGMEFVSMITSPSLQLDAATILSACQAVGRNGWLIYLNEPEQEGISVADAVAGWDTLVNDPNIIGYNIQLVSPTGTTSAGPRTTSQWLYDFMTQIQSLSRVRMPDAIALHRYNNGSHAILNWWAKYNTVYQGYRFWFTEFGPGVDGGLAANEAFMLEAWKDLVQSPSCDRVAWFELGYFLAETWLNLANTDGTLTALGTYWRNLTTSF